MENKKIYVQNGYVIINRLKEKGQRVKYIWSFHSYNTKPMAVSYKAYRSPGECKNAVDRMFKYSYRKDIITGALSMIIFLLLINA